MSKRIITNNELQQICLDAGADDTGFVEISRPAISPEYDNMLRIFPETQTIVSLVQRANRDGILSPSLPVVDWEFSKTYGAVSEAASGIIKRINSLGFRGVAIPPGFPMDMSRWPGKVWEVSHKLIAQEAGKGVMGRHRLVMCLFFSMTA
jgi:hypothetical protein